MALAVLSLLLLTTVCVVSIVAEPTLDEEVHKIKIVTTKNPAENNKLNDPVMSDIKSEPFYLLGQVYAKLDSLDVRMGSLESNLRDVENRVTTRLDNMDRHIADVGQWMTTNLTAKLISIVDNAKDKEEKMKEAMSASERRVVSLVESVKEVLRDGRSSTGVELRNIQTEMFRTEQRQTGQLTSVVKQIEDKLNIYSTRCRNEAGSANHFEIDSIFEGRFDNISAEVYSNIDKLLDDRLSNITASLKDSTDLQLLQLRSNFSQSLEAQSDALTKSVGEQANSINQTCETQKNTLKRYIDKKTGSLTQIIDNLSASQDATFQSTINDKIATLKSRVDDNAASVAAIVKQQRCEKGRPDNNASSTANVVIYPDVESIINSPYSCDATTNGGGWIVFLHRFQGDVEFYRDWAAYKRGFGSVTGDFWLGLDALHALTSSGSYELRVDLEYEGRSVFATYSTFRIGSESTNYRLSVDGYSGTAGDSFAGRHNGMEFTTLDRDNDLKYNMNCARDRHGGWWYSHCYDSNITGKWNLKGNFQAAAWDTLTGTDGNSVSFAEMKVRLVSG